MNLFNYNIKNFRLVLAAGTFIAFSMSCKKSGNAVNFPESASINIFNASHVYDSMGKTRNIYLSGLDTSANHFPLSFVGYDSYEIPRSGSLDGIRIDWPMRFYDFPAGSQRVRFTDTTGNTVADTTLNFESGSYSSIYIADDTAHFNSILRNGTFRIFAFPEKKSVTAGKVRIRYIDLLTDIDTISGYIFTPSRDKFTSQATPRKLLYGTASDYYDIDTSGLTIQGQMLLRIFQRNDTINYKTQVAIPATPGRTYTVVLLGNAYDWNCSFAVKQPDGSVVRKVIRYPPGIKGYVRTVD